MVAGPESVDAVARLLSDDARGDRAEAVLQEHVVDAAVEGPAEVA